MLRHLRYPHLRNYSPLSKPSMTSITFDCPSCEGSLMADDYLFGESVACPHCGKWIQIPFPGGSPSVEVPPPAPQDQGRKVMDDILKRQLEETREKLQKVKGEAAKLESSVFRLDGELSEKTERLKAAEAARESIAAELASTKAALEASRNETEGK